MESSKSLAEGEQANIFKVRDKGEKERRGKGGEGNNRLEWKIIEGIS